MPVLKNPKHEAFAQFRAKGKPQEEAYSLAGYKPDPGAASRLSKNIKVAARIAELAERTAQRAEIDIARVLRELVHLGLSDPRNLFNHDGSVKPPHEWDDATAAAVASVEVVEKDGADGKPVRTYRVKTWDKNSALEKIAKHLGMFIEKHEVTVTHRFEDMADDEIDREIIALAGETRKAGKPASRH